MGSSLKKFVFGGLFGCIFVWGAADALGQSSPQELLDKGVDVTSGVIRATGPGKIGILSSTPPQPAAVAHSSGPCPFAPETCPGFSCQTNVDVNTDNPGGTICAFSDLTSSVDGTRITENFFFLSSGEIRGVSWQGTMAQTSAQNEPAGECPSFVNPGFVHAPVANDTWNIRYYLNDVNKPGALIKEFLNVGPGVALGSYSRTDTGKDMGTGIGPLSVHDIVYTFDPVDYIDVNSLVTYWVEIESNYTLNECFFCWLVATPSMDQRSLQNGMANTDPPGTYFVDPDPDVITDDESTYDVTQRQDFCSSGAVQNPPEIELEVVGPASGTGPGCCTFKYTVHNRNSLGAGIVTEFWMAVAKGDGSNQCGEGLGDGHITPPPGYTVTYCKTWNSPTSKNRRAIYRFTGGSIPENDFVFGSITLEVNANQPVVLDPDNTVPAFGVRAWGSQPVPVLHENCGATSGPLNGEQGSWDEGNETLCELRPIPSMSLSGKFLLGTLIVGLGFVLVSRSKKLTVAT